MKQYTIQKAGQDHSWELVPQLKMQQLSAASNWVIPHLIPKGSSPLEQTDLSWMTTAGWNPFPTKVTWIG